MRSIILAWAAGLVATPCLAGSLPGTDIRTMTQESQPAARASLATLGALVTDQNAREMGFAAPGEAQQSELDVPMSDYLVGVDSLRGYAKGEDPMSLLRPTGQIVYPVRSAGTVRSSIILIKQGNNWRAVSFGAPALSKALDNTRTAVAGRDKVPVSSLFQVRIPALNLVFVGNTANGTLMLTSVADNDAYGVKRGVTQPAVDIFLRLKPEAERHNGLPR
jgi:hypothetical protein